MRLEVAAAAGESALGRLAGACPLQLPETVPPLPTGRARLALCPFSAPPCDVLPLEPSPAPSASSLPSPPLLFCAATRNPFHTPSSLNDTRHVLQHRHALWTRCAWFFVLGVSLSCASMNGCQSAPGPAAGPAITMAVSRVPHRTASSSFARGGDGGGNGGPCDLS